MEVTKETSEAVQPIEAARKLDSFSELFKQAVSIYRRLFKKLIALSFMTILAVAPFVLAYAASALLIDFIAYKAIAYLLSAILMLAAIVSVFYFSSAVQAGSLLLLEQQDLSVNEVFESGRKIAWQYVLVMIITGIMVGLWTILLFIPGLIFAVYYSMTQYIVVFENQTGYATLQQSKRLVSGYWWAVVWRWVFMGAIYMILLTILSAPLSYLVEGSTWWNIWNYIVHLVNLVLSPILVVFGYLVYKNLKQIKGNV